MTVLMRFKNTAALLGILAGIFAPRYSSPQNFFEKQSNPICLAEPAETSSASLIFSLENQLSTPHQFPTPHIIFGELKPVTGFHNQDKLLSEIVSDYLAENNPPQLKRKIIVDKSKRRLGVYLDDVLLKEYGISLGFDPVGHKLNEGDGRTPEGEYYVAAKNPNSRYYLALLLNYPNPDDAQQGLASGLINPRQYQAIIEANENCETPPQNTPLGSFFELHGLGGGPDQPDWTAGCIALDDEAIGEVYDFSTPCETKVIINP